MSNPQYDYDYREVLAPLQERNDSNFPGMIAPPHGWVELVLNLDSELSHILPDYTIAQVKEKFGGLRYYIESYGVDPDDPRVEIAKELIAEAEEASKSMCQICGEEGHVHDARVWCATLCDDHVDSSRWGS